MKNRDTFVKKDLKNKELAYRDHPRGDLRLLANMQKLPIDWRALTTSRQPTLKITANGISIGGFKLKLDLNQLPSSKIAWILGLGMLPELTGATDSSYYFADLENTIYRLWMSGIVDLSQVVTALKSGNCNTTSTDQTPQDLVLIKNYYDHGGTVPIFEAVLTRDTNGITDETVVSCVSDLITKAHDAWSHQTISWSGIAAIIGGLLALTVVAGSLIYFCRRQRIAHYAFPTPELIEQDAESADDALSNSTP